MRYVYYGQLEFDLVAHDLVAFFRLEEELCSHRTVTSHDPVERFGQRNGVQRTHYTDGARQVVSRRSRIELVQEQQPLLTKRYRKNTFI
jgi:hypothetical protein